MPDGECEYLNEYVAVTKLGKNLYYDGMLSDETITSTVNAALEMQSIALKEGAQNLIVTASSVVRDASNRSKFLLKCNQALNIYPQVLSGKEEAKFAYSGATSDLEADIPIVMINIGGGISEIAYGTKDNLKGVHCLNVGAIKLQQKFNLSKSSSLSIIPGFSPSKQARDFIIEGLKGKVDEGIYSWLSEHKPLVLACGGTATTYAAMLKKQFIYDRDLINYTESTRKEIMSLYKRIVKMSISARMALPGMEADRAGIMPAGLLILSTILKYYKFEEFSITVRGMRMGILRYFLSR
jgi:exopolyphosphatase/guanosine-5'-triphosphate,3'-diphosphate pyrophosphatase